HCATRAFAAEIERSTGGWLLRRAGRDRLAYELADAAQRTDQLRRFDREQDGLGVRAGRELADRLGVLLRDEIVDRLVATLRDRVRHHLRRLGFGFGLAFAGFGLAERRLALDRKSTRLNSSHVKISYA